jgi:hypothetical protein
MKKVIILLVCILVLCGCEASQNEKQHYFSAVNSKQGKELVEYWSGLSLKEVQDTDLFCYTPMFEHSIGEFRDFVHIEEVNAQKLRSFTDDIISYLYDWNKFKSLDDLKKVEPFLDERLYKTIIECDDVRDRIEKVIDDNVVTNVQNNPKTLMGDYVKEFVTTDQQIIYRVDTSFCLFTFADDSFYKNNKGFEKGDTKFNLYLYIDATNIDDLKLISWQERFHTRFDNISINYKIDSVDKKIAMSVMPDNCSQYNKEHAGEKIANCEFIKKAPLTSSEAWDVYAFIYTFIQKLYTIDCEDTSNYLETLDEYLADECKDDTMLNQSCKEYANEIKDSGAKLRVKIMPALMKPHLFPHRNENVVYEYLKDSKKIYAVKVNIIAELVMEQEEKILNNTFINGTWGYDVWIFFEEDKGEYYIHAFKTGLNANGGTTSYTLDENNSDEELEVLGYKVGDIVKKD